MPTLTDKSTTTVTITRNTGSWGVLTPITIFANNEKIGQLNKYEQTILNMGEGIAVIYYPIHHQNSA